MLLYMEVEVAFHDKNVMKAWRVAASHEQRYHLLSTCFTYAILSWSESCFNSKRDTRDVKRSQ